MTRRVGLFLPLVCALLLAACRTPEEAVRIVDERAAAAIAARAEAHGLDPSPADPAPAPGRVRESVVDPSSGRTTPGSTLHLDLASLLRIAAANSREFQDQKERVYRAALAYLREREQFALRPESLFSTTVTSTAGEESLAAEGGFGLTRTLERGGALALSLGLDFLRFVSSPTSEDLASLLRLSISLPFLRNGGREIVEENLTQADRDLLYALRDFERFKQTFGVRILSSYLRILSQKQRVTNEIANVQRLALTRARNEAMFEEGRMRVVEVDQARQQELSGRSRLIAAEAALERSLDTLKDELGLPIDLAVTLGDGDLQGLASPLERSLDVAEEAALVVALKARLDLRNSVDGVADSARRVRVAENQLLPDLGLDIGLSARSDDLRPLRYNFRDGIYSATASFDLGLYREFESLALRQSLLDLARSLRDQEATVESVKSQVREALRQLLLAADDYRISLDAFRLAEKRVASTDALLAEGRVSTRDFLESQSAYLSSQNNLLDATVSYRVATLELLRDTGVVVIGAEGLDDEASRRALLVD
jgi:outer membrane protein TolC